MLSFFFFFFFFFFFERKMEGERLTNSLWYKTLLRRFQSLCMRAAKESMFVCIPQTVSLVTTRITERDVLHHIVRSSGVRGEFETLSGRKVVITGAEIIAGDGFPKRVVARIIGSDKIKFTPEKSSKKDGDVDNLNLSVYFLTRPLEGGVEAPSSVDDIDHASVLQTIAMIRSAPETESLFDALQDAVALARLDIQGIAPGQDVPQIEEYLQQQCEAVADAIVSSSLYLGYEDKSSSSGRGSSSSSGSGSGRRVSDGARGRIPRRHVLQVLESWTMEQLHDDVLPALAASAAVRGEVEKLSRVFGALAGSTMEDFKIKPTFRCNLNPAVAALGLLRSAATPLEKLHCLRDTSLTLQRCVERHLEAQGTDLADVEYATDDILDMLLWVLVTGNGEHRTCDMPAHLAYITRFHFAAENELVTSRLGYYLANFEQALGYFIVNAEELLANPPRRQVQAAAAAAAGRGDEDSSDDLRDTER